VGISHVTSYREFTARCKSTLIDEITCGQQRPGLALCRSIHSLTDSGSTSHRVLKAPGEARDSRQGAQYLPAANNNNKLINSITVSFHQSINQNVGKNDAWNEIECIRP
jgi:hypothetical protein